MSLFGAASSSGGSLFGNTTTSTTGTSLFGNTSTPSLFGVKPATATPSLFGAAKPTATASLFGAKPATSTPSLFGAAAPAAGTSLFGAAAKPTTFSFNTPAAAPATGGLFGTAAPATIQLYTGTSMFGTAAPTAGSMFGTAAPAAGSMFGATAPAAGSMFGQPAPQAQPAQAAGGLNDLNSLAAVAQSLSLPIICGDERDMLYAKFNQLQAYWGHGTIILNQSGATFPMTPESPFSRFKSVGYCRLPSTKNEDGLVGVFIDKPLADVTSFQTQLVATLHKIIGGKQEHVVCCDTVRAASPTSSEVIVYVLQRSPTGATQRIPATDLTAALTSPATASQLKSQMFVSNVMSKVAFTSSQLSLYLDKPPVGISPVLWEQAKQENPDPDKLIPVPLVGFKAISERLRLQKEQSEAHFARVELIGKEVEDVKAVQASTLSRLHQLKRKHLELTHRVLQVMVDVEVQRKAGFSLQPEEEHLRVQFESIHQELNASNQFKGRLSEMLSSVRMQSLTEPSPAPQSQVDASTLSNMHAHIQRQQQGIQHLLDILKADMSHVSIISQGLAEKQAAPAAYS